MSDTLSRKLTLNLNPWHLCREYYGIKDGMCSLKCAIFLVMVTSLRGLVYPGQVTSYYVSGNR
jgi:hypothetical protein